MCRCESLDISFTISNITSISCCCQCSRRNVKPAFIHIENPTTSITAYVMLPVMAVTIATIKNMAAVRKLACHGLPYHFTSRTKGRLITSKATSKNRSCAVPCRQRCSLPGASCAWDFPISRLQLCREYALSCKCHGAAYSQTQVRSATAFTV